MTSDHEKLDEALDRAAVAFHPPLMLLVLIVIGVAAQWVANVTLLPASLAMPIGIPVVAVALLLFGWAVITMLSGGASIPTNTATDAIVESGPFRLSRNPIYLGMVLFLIGIGIWANSAWFVGFALVAIGLLTRYVIQPEEQYLEDKFGEAYLSYKRRVRRWI